MVLLCKGRVISHSSDAAILKIQGPMKEFSLCLGAL